MRDASSRMVTSQLWCEVFSIIQCARIRTIAPEAKDFVGHRQQEVEIKRTGSAVSEPVHCETVPPADGNYNGGRGGIYLNPAIAGLALSDAPALQRS